ncbi:hypothetical protein F3N42_10355 [Marinihelvus fidelis]|uniref:Type II secretion system protein GspC N-terminal domain-containing protein n=1 Tax=Marinihelvus fidelis TaxID=2613842 RepID=A0A5N0T9F5_9GAMM|nr:hypothetical protein [Marinihelvus fidelis]KAA9130767.1 hypothetical protein F3N42_10355 [Marinihelvus fidelis]
MSWAENNPVGLALAGFCGLLVAIALVLGLAWSGPGSVDIDPDADELATPVTPDTTGLVLGDRDEYQVINDRPLFNETRRPETIEVIEGEDVEEPVEALASEVANRPDVRLTGVVITPEQSYVSLTPTKGGESVVTQIGAPLEDQAYVGWKVESVGARSVELASARGETFSLDLSVYDTVIEAPPELEQRAIPGMELPPEEGEPTEDGERLSRAEEIRQRIAERREQLRQEAEQEAETEADRREAHRNQYQDAMRAMINRNNTDSEQSDENE